MSKLIAYYDHFNDVLQRSGNLEINAEAAESGGNKVTRYYAEAKHDAAYPRLVLALRNLADAPTDDNGAAVRIELRRTARLLLAELGEIAVCLHGSGRTTPYGWMCTNCGAAFSHDIPLPLRPNAVEGDPLSPANAWPGIPEFLKRKAP